jgi:hypothetical protein
MIARLSFALVPAAACLVLGHASAQAPIVTELMALNSSGLRDEDGDESDWIELYNPPTAGVIDLGGWSLTDDAGDLTQWTFQAGTALAPGAFLVVFASDKDRRNPAGTLHTNFKLSGNGEPLLLVDPGGVVVSGFSPQFPPQFDDISYGLEFALQPTANERYFTTPTPGAPNVGGGPPAWNVTHTPHQPSDTQALVVTVQVPTLPSGAPTVTLRYRVMYGSQVSLAMRDDGVAPDAVANDQVYTAQVPAGASSPGEMIRYKVLVNDGTATTTLPPFLEPLGSPEWFGTVVIDPSHAPSPLPVWEWFVQNPSAATTETGTRCSLWVEGRFYDNVEVHRRGNTSAGYPRKSFKFDFNPGDRLELAVIGNPIDEANINTHWADKAHLRQAISYDVYTETGSPSLVGFPVRMQQNAVFYSVQTFIEEPDRFYLERLGLDTDGALYKMFNELTSATVNVEKVTRQFEGNADLAALVSALAAGGPTMETYLFDNIDVPRVLSYLAATWVLHDNDHVHKNYFLYRDSDGDGEWHFIPWDKDLTWGRNYELFGGVLNDNITHSNPQLSHVLMGDRLHPKVDGFWNRLIDRVYENPRLRTMYLRRLRTICDEFLQPNSTPLGERWIESRVDHYVMLLSADVALDVARWGLPNWGAQQTFVQAKDRLLNDYVVNRRNYFYGASQASSGGLVPAAEPAKTALSFTDVDHSPQSGIQDEEYLELTNAAAWATDLSGFTLSGGITMTMPAGTVVEPGGKLYLSPDVATFRARTIAPHGGMRCFVIGPYDGHLAPGEQVLLRDRQGRVRARFAL